MATPIEMHFCVAGPPVPKGRPRLGRGGHVFTPLRTTEYEELVKATALEARPSCWERSGRFDVTIELKLKINRGDIDNYIKAILDGCNGIAWVDDCQVVRILAEKKLDKKQPEAKILIRRIG